MVLWVLANSLLNGLISWDKDVFQTLNSKWINPFFDSIFPWLRDPAFWVPLYVFLLAFMIFNFGVKGLWWSLMLICTVAMSDLIGARVFKEDFERLRPCNDPDLFGQVRLLLKNCSTSFSFVSNHAANHFGIATFFVLSFRGLFKYWAYLAYFWGFVVSYAQIYVGAHFPLDVIGGALLGILLGSLTAWIFHRKWGTFNLDNQIS